MFDPLWCAPRAPGGSRARPARRADRLARPARQVPGAGARGRALPRHAPAHDRQPAVGRRRTTTRRRPHLRVRLVLDDGHRLLFIDQRRFGTGVVIDGRDALDALPRRAARARSRSSPASRPDVLRARPRAARRRSRRSCSTSAASRASATSTPTRRCSARGSTRCARPAGCAAPRSSGCTRRSSTALEAGHRAPGRLDRRLPRLQRRARLDAGRVPGLPARGRAVRALRAPGREAARRRTRHLRLPPLPAGAARAARGARERRASLPDGFEVGHWTDAEAATGCTVVLPPPDGAVASGDVRGGGPGTREIDLLDPLANAARDPRGPADRRQRVRPGGRRRRDALARAQWPRLRDAGRARAARARRRSSTTS